MKLLISSLGSHAKLGLVAVTGVVGLFGLGNTTVGQQLISQIGISDTLARTSDAAGRIAQKGSNAVQAFLGRSPGERGATDMLKGKAQRDLAQDLGTPAKGKPAQRALGKTFDEPLQSLAGPIAPAPVVEFLPLDANSSAVPLPAIALPIPSGSGGFGPVFGGGPSGGGFIGGGGGSGGSGNVPVPPIAPPAPPPITAAVPEPSTWILLLMGFAAVGASVRRSKKGTGKSERAGNCAPA